MGFNDGWVPWGGCHEGGCEKEGAMKGGFCEKGGVL